MANDNEALLTKYTATPYGNVPALALLDREDITHSLEKDFTVAKLRERIMADIQSPEKHPAHQHLYNTIFRPCQNTKQLTWPTNHLIRSLANARHNTASHIGTNQTTHSYIEKLHSLNKELSKTLHELKPRILLTAYRIIRKHGQLKNLFTALTPLATGLNPDFGNPLSLTFNNIPADPYTAPSLTNIMALYRQNIDLPHGLIQTLIDANNLPEEDMVEFDFLTPEGFTLAKAPGISIAPPHPTSRHYDPNDHTLNPSYDPANDQALTTWIRLIQQIANSLNIYEGSEQDPTYGSISMEVLTDPYLARIAWPSKAEIIEFEKLLLKDVANIIIMCSITEADTRIITKYGMTQDEAYGINKLARAMLRDHYTYTQEEAKSIYTAKLDQLASDNSLDPRIALLATKQMSLIHGLGRDTSGSSLGDILSAFNQSRSLLEDGDDGDDD